MKVEQDSNYHVRVVPETHFERKALESIPNPLVGLITPAEGSCLLIHSGPKDHSKHEWAERMVLIIDGYASREYNTAFEMIEGALKDFVALRKERGEKVVHTPPSLSLGEDGKGKSLVVRDDFLSENFCDLIGCMKEEK